MEKHQTLLASEEIQGMAGENWILQSEKAKAAKGQMEAPNL